MKQEGLLKSALSVFILSAVVILVVSYFIYHKHLIGPVLLLLSILPLIPLKISDRSIRSVGADIVYGTIDTGILGIAALIGAKYAGALGAVVGGAVGDAVTDGIAGLFEGKVSEVLRRYGIDEARTPLSSSMGKMSGCLMGIGITLTIAWTVIGL